MNEQPIRVLDLFSGIGGFAVAAEIANAMADAECEQDHGVGRTGACGRRNETAQRNDGQAGANCACGCGEDVADTDQERCNGQPVRLQSGRSRQAGVEATRSRFTSIAHAEVEPFACAVYHRHFPDSVCFGGVQNVTRDSLLERCGALPDVVCGGFPCQPHSCAGKRLASADERDLWGECRRILGDVRPRFALWENVGGLLTSESGLFFNRVLSDLAALRYACQWQVVPASAVGAPHRRDRVWLLCWDELADADQAGRGELRGAEPTGEKQRSAECGGLAWPALSGQWPSRPGEQQHGWEPPRVVGNAASQRPSTCGSEPAGQQREASTTGAGEQAGQREVEPSLGLLPDGLPAALGGDWPEVHNRVAQLKAAGNAIVPEAAAIFMYAILRMYNG